MTLHIDANEYGETVTSDLVGNIRASDYYINDIIKKLDALFVSDFDNAVITADDSNVFGIYMDKPFLDHNGDAIPVKLERIVVRKNGKWEMMSAAKNIISSLFD